MTRDKAIAELVRIWNSPHLDLSLKAGLGEAIDALKGEDGDLINSLPSAGPCDKDAISREGLLRSWEELSPRGRTEFDQVIMTIPAIPSAEPKTDEESELRFYYVESIDGYWIGQRLDNFYYADWHEGLGYISRQDALDILDDFEADIELGKRDSYKAHREKLLSLPSAEPKTGGWMKVIDEETPNVTKWHYECDQCGAGRFENGQQYCSRCGARMLGEDGE